MNVVTLFGRTRPQPASTLPLPAPRRSATSSKKRSPVTDDDLVDRLYAGDSVAADDLLERHRPTLFGDAYAILRDETEAEQIVDRALLGTDPWLPQRGRVGRWLRTLVRRRARARMRALVGCGR